MSGHIPVMLTEVLEALQPRDGGRYIDGTFGGGGYSRAILEAANCCVLAIDRDPDAIERGEQLAALFRGRLSLMRGEFSNMDTYFAEQGPEKSDGVVLDLGVSSFQLDDPERGFSFREDAPLDMRMSKSGKSAAELVNEIDEKGLADILAQLGEERQARRVARAIVAARPINRTKELAEIVAKALGPAALRQPIHPATRTFQALRIYVNEELSELERGLGSAERVLKAGGRLAVVAFHSLEDRVVKRFLADRSRETPAGSRHLPGKPSANRQTFRLLWSRPRMPSAAEIERNPRARSARLRAAERTALAA
jgi:16S rRNA (cytosine1402-N4)-methyltransferase